MREKVLKNERLKNKGGRVDFENIAFGLVELKISKFQKTRQIHLFEPFFKISQTENKIYMFLPSHF